MLLWWRYSIHFSLGGTTGELKVLYKRNNSVQSKFVAISEFGGISGDGIAGYNSIFNKIR